MLSKGPPSAGACERRHESAARSALNGPGRLRLTKNFSTSHPFLQCFSAAAARPKRHPSPPARRAAPSIKHCHHRRTVRNVRSLIIEVSSQPNLGSDENHATEKAGRRRRTASSFGYSASRPLFVRMCAGVYARARTAACLRCAAPVLACFCFSFSSQDDWSPV